MTEAGAGRVQRQTPACQHERKMTLTWLAEHKLPERPAPSAKPLRSQGPGPRGIPRQGRPAALAAPPRRQPSAGDFCSLSRSCLLPAPHNPKKKTGVALSEKRSALKLGQEFAAGG